MSYSTRFRRQSKWLRDKFPFCVLCGEDAEHTHHIDGDKTNDSWLNEIPLCASCHGSHPERDPELTAKLKQIRKEMWAESELWIEAIDNLRGEDLAERDYSQNDYE